MKKKFKIEIKIEILVLWVTFLLWNCQNENLVYQSKISSRNISKLKAYQVNPDSIFKVNHKLNNQILKNFYSQTKSNKKSLTSSKYGFSIDTSLVQKIEAPNYESFTFVVERENKNPNILENYMLTLFSNDNISQLLIAYPKIINNEIVTYDIANATAQLINDNNLLLKNSNAACESSVEEIIEWDESAGECISYNCKPPTGSGYHAPGESCNATGEDRASRKCTGGWVVTGCVDSGGSSGTGNGSGTTSGGGSGGGSTGNSTSNEPDSFNDPDIGITPLDKPEKLDFDEQIFIDEEFKNNPCLKSVYDGMGKTTKFKAYLQNFEPEFSVAHLRLKYDENFKGNKDPKYWNALAITEPPLGDKSNTANYNINIKFNGDTNLNTSIHNKPKLIIAVAFIHEMIHAEVFRKMLSAAQQGHLNTSQYTTQNRIDYVNSLRNNFPGIYDYYVERWKSDWGHQQMAQHYRNIIVGALKEFDNNQHTQAQYEAVAWLGLENTIAWNNLRQTKRDHITQTRTNFIKNDINKCN